MTATTLENAHVVRHDGDQCEPLAFCAGRVVRAPVPEAMHIDLRDHVILPGLINAHEHLHLNGIVPLDHARPFSNSYEWIEAWSQRHRAAPRDRGAASRDEQHWQGGLKNVLAGATMVAHHDPWHTVLLDPDFPVGLVKDFGWCHSLRLGSSSFDRQPRYGPPVLETFKATRSTTPWIIHLAEGTDEIAAAELSQLDAMGCLASNTVLVHAVGLSSRDVDRVIEAGASVVWCPSSNLSMLGRTLDVRRLFDAGCLALGTDSRLTGSRDLLEELKVAQANSDLTPSELLRLTTTDAARILRASGAGGLAVGQRADCVILAASVDPAGALLDARRADIRAVVRSGMPVMADPDFASWFEHCEVPFARVRLDGRDKLIASALLMRLRNEAEPGLCPS